ncbi:MAG: RNA polymerase sigma factor SigJ [Ardenticatenaceae bacterium]|nr:RNA polymerase sigma factor SigJ [Ardenticatenaceae bacterium]
MDDLFEEFRPRLMAIAYRMLGEVPEAEDMVQEAFIRWHEADQTRIDNPRGWLTTVVTRLCIDRLRVLQKQRETYTGPWLPTPVVMEPADAPYLRHETLSYALLVLLETLSPVERAVFLLREAFGFEYETIGKVVERTATNCRQIFSRAKGHLKSGSNRFSTPEETHDRLFYQFIATCQSGNLNDLVGLLSDEITVWSDSGGKVPAARHPVYGVDKAARFMLGLVRLAPADVRLEFKRLNGRLGMVVWQNEKPITAMVLDLEGEKINNIYFMRNPDKLRWV